MLKYPEPTKGTLPYKIGGTSQFFNGWIGAGSRDQTFSARTWEGRIKGITWCKYMSIFIDGLFFWVEDHTERSFYSDDELTYELLPQIKHFTEKD